MVRIYPTVAAEDRLAACVRRRETEIRMHASRVSNAAVLHEALEMVGCRNVDSRHGTQGCVEHPAWKGLRNASSESEHPREVHLAICCDVEYPIYWIVDGVLKRIDGVAVMDELEPGVETKQGWHNGKCEVSADRISYLGSKDWSESERCEHCFRVGFSCLADEPLHLCEVTLMPTWLALRPCGLGKDRRVARAGTIDRGVGFYDHRTDRCESLNRTEESE